MVIYMPVAAGGVPVNARVIMEEGRTLCLLVPVTDRPPLYMLSFACMGHYMHPGLSGGRGCYSLCSV